MYRSQFQFTWMLLALKSKHLCQYQQHLPSSSPDQHFSPPFWFIITTITQETLFRSLVARNMSVRLLSNQNVQDSWVETPPVGGRLRVQMTPLDECLYFEKLPKTRSSYLSCRNVGRKSLRISERTASVYRWFPRSVQCKFQLGTCRSYARTWSLGLSVNHF